MIIISTTSPAESRYAERALAEGVPVPEGIGWEVYLNGRLAGSRTGKPVHPAAEPEWPALPETREQLNPEDGK
jgi:hypothetical protein